MVCRAGVSVPNFRDGSNTLHPRACVLFSRPLPCSSLPSTMTISPPFFPQLFPNIFCCPTVDWSWGGNFTDIVDVYAAWLSSSCPRVVPAQVTSERANFGQRRDPVPGIFEVIKDQGISPGKPHPCFWSRLFLMPKNSGSVAAAISQAQRRSNRVNRGCNGRDVQLD